jgi:SAM-dependent methyltransferase
MRCPVCETNKWTNVDHLRIAAKGMHICDNCGFVSYPKAYKTEDEIKAHYETNYRQCPSVQNAFTGQKKLHIHSAFLTPLLKEWKDKGFKDPVIGEVGAAYGMFLNWIRGHFPEADISGTEYTRSYRRNAWWEYGIKLDVDFDLTKKYDLITSFKVAEHQLDIDLRLREYAQALKPEGFLYISVPLWFHRMTNFGAEGFDLEYYYDKNHINVWTRDHFEYLLSKAGLEIIRTDEWLYDSTYLCKRNDAVIGTKPVPQVKTLFYSSVR